MQLTDSDRELPVRKTVEHFVAKKGKNGPQEIALQLPVLFSPTGAPAPKIANPKTTQSVGYTKVET